MGIHFLKLHRDRNFNFHPMLTTMLSYWIRVEILWIYCRYICPILATIYNVKIPTGNSSSLCFILRPLRMTRQDSLGRKVR